MLRMHFCSVSHSFEALLFIAFCIPNLHVSFKEFKNEDLSETKFRGEGDVNRVKVKGFK